MIRKSMPSGLTRGWYRFSLATNAKRLRGDHAQTKKIERDEDSKKSHPALTARQCDRGAPELALGSDHDGLLVAARGQGDIRVESGCARDNLKIAAAAASLKGSADATAAFAPGAGKRSALGDDIAAEIEFVAVAGAEEPLVEAVAASAHSVGGTTSDFLGRSVIEGDGTAAGPVAGHAGERPRLGVAGAVGYRRHQQRKGGDDQSSDDRAGFHG